MNAFSEIMKTLSITPYECIITTQISHNIKIWNINPISCRFPLCCQGSSSSLGRDKFWGRALVSGTTTLAADPLGPVGCSFQPPWIRHECFVGLRSGDFGDRINNLELFPVVPNVVGCDHRCSDTTLSLAALTFFSNLCYSGFSVGSDWTI